VEFVVRPVDSLFHLPDRETKCLGKNVEEIHITKVHTCTLRGNFFGGAVRMNFQFAQKDKL